MFGPFKQLIEIIPDSENQRYAIIDESQFENMDLVRPNFNSIDLPELYDNLVKVLFENSSSYSPNLSQEILSIIQENRPINLDKGYLIVSDDKNHIYRFEFPKPDHVLGILVGDNQGARIHEMQFRPEDNTNRGRVILGKELSIRKFGDDETCFDYTFFFDKRFGWWNKLFGAFNHLFVDDIERETFEVSQLDTTIALEGWLDCETGLDDLNCHELHKRLRPFVIQAICTLF